MSKTQSINFYEVIEMIEMLPEEEQETLLDIIRHRLKERGREISDYYRFGMEKVL